MRAPPGGRAPRRRGRARGAPPPLPLSCETLRKPKPAQQGSASHRRSHSKKLAGREGAGWGRPRRLGAVTLTSGGPLARLPELGVLRPVPESRFPALSFSPKTNLRSASLRSLMHSRVPRAAWAPAACSAPRCAHPIPTRAAVLVGGGQGARLWTPGSEERVGEASPETGGPVSLVPAPLTHSAAEANDTPRTHLCSLCQARSQDRLCSADNSVRGASVPDPTHSF